jgi:hypothetical protein
LTALSEAFAKKLLRYPEVPAALVGRLTVDRQHRNKRLGETLLLDAMRRTLQSGLAAATSRSLLLSLRLSRYQTGTNAGLYAYNRDRKDIIVKVGLNRYSLCFRLRSLSCGLGIRNSPTGLAELSSS